MAKLIFIIHPTKQPSLSNKLGPTHLLREKLFKPLIICHCTCISPISSFQIPMLYKASLACVT